MADKDVFSVLREVSRREVERHKGDLIGITSSAPAVTDVNGKLEYTCDVRIGVRENQGLIKGVLVSQWIVGVITDLGVPVLMQKSEAGLLTIVARAQVRLPDISLRSYSYNELGFLFMTNLTEQEPGVWVDGYGYPASDPTSDVGVSEEWSWIQQVTSLDELGEDGTLGQSTADWEVSY
jgi:hypothetical protein